MPNKTSNMFISIIQYTNTSKEDFDPFYDSDFVFKVNIFYEEIS